jgi:hypothetical protein
MTQKLTAEQASVLVGSMLGDGHLQLNREYRSINARLIIRRSIKDEAYLLWERSIFKEFCSEKSIRRYADYNKNVDKTYHGISFTTLAHPIFTEYHVAWYLNVKRVPHNLSLDTLIMLIWFLDDGCAIRNESGKLEIKFSTEGFCEDDVLFLLDLLRHKYGQKYTSYLNQKPKNTLQSGLRICGYGPAADAIIDDISSIYPYDLMGRKAVWRQPYTPKIHSFDIKRDKIKEYLSGKDIFYTNDLGRFAGFTFQRKNRKGGIGVATGNLKNYLLPYLEDGLIVRLIDDDYHLGHKYGITDAGKDYFSQGELV